MLEIVAPSQEILVQLLLAGRGDCLAAVRRQRGTCMRKSLANLAETINKYRIRYCLQATLPSSASRSTKQSAFCCTADLS